MEYSKTYALIPESELSKHVPSKKQLSEFDKEMQKILNSDLQDFEKVLLYYELLKRKMNLHNFNQPWKIQQPEKNDKFKEDEHEIKTESENIHDDSKILNILPQGLRKQGSQLLEFLKTDPNKLKWNNRGEIIYKNNIITNSNLSDLLSLVLGQRKNYKHVIGTDEFLQALQEMNAPKFFFKNKHLPMNQEFLVSSKTSKPVVKNPKKNVELPFVSNVTPISNWESL